jgi:hypothetical protein
MQLRKKQAYRISSILLKTADRQLCTSLPKASELKEDMIGGILGNFKALLDQAGHFANDVLAFGKLVHSCLSAVLSNIDDMR